LNSSPLEDDGTNTDKLEMKVRSTLHLNSTDPNLTLISVYSDTTKAVQVNVQRSTLAVSSNASQLFSLFKLPKRPDLTASTPNSETLQVIEGTVKTENSTKNDTIVEASKPSKTGRRSRFLSFVRYLFCQLVSVGSNATVTPINDPPIPEEPPVDPNPTQLSPSTTIVFVETPAPVRDDQS
jgi:hypothetical protein